MGFLDLFKRKDSVSNTSVNNLNKDIPFCITVQDIFPLVTGKDIVIVGTIASGSVSEGDTVTLKRQDGTSRSVRVGVIELNGNLRVKKASAGTRVGIMLNEITKSEICAGDILAK